MGFIYTESVDAPVLGWMEVFNVTGPTSKTDCFYFFMFSNPVFIFDYFWVLNFLNGTIVSSEDGYVWTVAATLPDPCLYIPTALTANPQYLQVVNNSIQVGALEK